MRKLEKTGEGAEPEQGLPSSIHSKVASVIGIEKLKGIRLSELFAEVFSKHSRDEVENNFTTGTEKSTPDILEEDASWPKPWLFMRMTIASLVLFFLLWAGWKQFANTNLLPGLMMVGSFAIPVSTLVLFIELNIRSGNHGTPVHKCECRGADGTGTGNVLQIRVVRRLRLQTCVGMLMRPMGGEAGRLDFACGSSGLRMRLWFSLGRMRRKRKISLFAILPRFPHFAHGCRGRRRSRGTRDPTGVDDDDADIKPSSTITGRRR